MSQESATLEDLAEVEQRLDRQIEALRAGQDLSRVWDEIHIIKRTLASVLHRLEGISASARDEHAGLAASLHDHMEGAGLGRNPGVPSPRELQRRKPKPRARQR